MRLRTPFVLIKHSLGTEADSIVSSDKLAKQMARRTFSVAPISHLARGNYRKNDQAEEKASNMTVAEFLASNQPSGPTEEPRLFWSQWYCHCK